MNNATDLIQLRLGIGGQLQVRQRKAERPTFGGMLMDGLIVSHEWGEWETVPALKGDESDKQFD